MRTVTDLLVSGWLGNLTSLSSLQLLAGLSDADAARLCLVSPHTYRRWRTDRRPNPTAVRLLAILAGYVPWAGWERWEMHNGYLFPPGYERGGMRPGDVLAVPFQRQLQAAYEERIASLEAELFHRGADRARVQ